MSKVYVRPSEKKDYEELRILNNLIWNSTNTPSTINYSSVKEYGDNFPAGSQIVAIVNGEVAGYLGYHNPTGLITNKHVLELDIGVHPNFQRMGVGKQLLDYIYKWGKENGITKVAIRVLATNPHALSFYRKNGFIEQGRLVNEFFIDGQYIDDLLMYRNL